MPYRLRKLRDAGTEADVVAAWYEERKPGLGFGFLDQIDRTVEIIGQNPFRYGVRFGDVRRAPVRGFRSYGIYYFVQGEEVIIISVFSDRRDPQSLRERRQQVV